MATCPSCGKGLAEDAAVCRHCLHVLDRERWRQHDAGRLGADGRGGGHEHEDPPVGPVPLTAAGMGGIGTEGAALGSGLRLAITGKLLRWGRRR
jgi:hypothetical protein